MNYQSKLKQLREDWKKYPEKRKIVELQAKLLEMAQGKADSEYARIRAIMTES